MKSDSTESNNDIELYQDIPNNINKASLSDFTMISVIGKGTQGKVMLVKHKDGKLYAMKMLRKKELKKLNQIERTKNERFVLEQLNHPFIVDLKQAFQNAEKLYLILEQCPAGELFFHVSINKGLDERKAVFQVAQMILVLEYMHKHNIIQRDLKPENVLIDSNGYCKLTDFGFVKRNINDNKSAFSFCGTPEQLAPEIINKVGHGKAVDWWSLGCFTQEIICGYPPFYTNDKAKLYDKIRNVNIKFSKRMSNTVVNFIKQLLDPDPNKRLGGINGASDVKQHIWLQGINWELLLNKDIRPPLEPIEKECNNLKYFDKVFTREKLSCSQEESEQYSFDDEFQDDFDYNHENNSEKGCTEYSRNSSNNYDSNSTECDDLDVKII